MNTRTTLRVTVLFIGAVVTISAMVAMNGIKFRPQPSEPVMTTQDADDNGLTIVPFDAERAAKLGADQYGMKSYVLAYLKAGPNRDLSADETAALQEVNAIHATIARENP